MPTPNLNITIEDAQLKWPNFEGREGLYNERGERDFNVILNDDFAQKLLADGWNVKGGGEDAEGNPQEYWLPVAVGFNKFPPRIYLITKKGRIQLEEDDLSAIDSMDIKMADMTIRGAFWPKGWTPSSPEKGGIKAWLRTLFVTINQDPLDEKYGVWDDRSKPEKAEED